MTTVRGDVATMSDSVLQDYHTVSHSSGIAPPEELAPLVAAIKSGGGATNWAAVRYASPTSLAMLGSGDGGFVEMLGAFDDGAVAYGAFAAAIGTQLKLTFVSFVGPDVSGLERARVSMHRSDVMRFFDPVVSLDLQEKDDVSTACDEMRAAVAATLSSVGDAASVRLNSNEAAEAAAVEEAAEATPAEDAPLPGLDGGGGDAERADLVAALAEAGIGPRARDTVASELPPSLWREAARVARLVATHVDDAGEISRFVGGGLLPPWSAAEEGGRTDADVSTMLGVGPRWTVSVVLRELLRRPLESPDDPKLKGFTAELSALAMPELRATVAALAERRPEWLHARRAALECVQLASCVVYGIEMEPPPPDPCAP